MHLKLLSNDFRVVKDVEDFESLAWRRLYYGIGDFTLHCTSALWPYIKESTYLYRTDRPREIARIYSPTVNEDKAVVKGEVALHRLYRRVIYPTHHLNGHAETALKLLVRTFSPYKTAADKGLGDILATQVTGGDLLEYILSVCKEQQLGVSLDFDGASRSLVFDVWKGKDRTGSDPNHQRVLFSEEWENATRFEYSASDSEYRNYAIVAGEGEGSARVAVEVDTRENSSEEKFFLWVDARDLQKEGGESSAQYRERLRRRGLEKLAEYKKIETVSFSALSRAGKSYGEDYDLGDIVVAKSSKLGLLVKSRIVEVWETFEKGREPEVTLTFGENYLTEIDYIVRKLT